MKNRNNLGIKKGVEQILSLYLSEKITMFGLERFMDLYNIIGKELMKEFIYELECQDGIILLCDCLENNKSMDNVLQECFYWGQSEKGSQYWYQIDKIYKAKLRNQSL